MARRFSMILFSAAIACSMVASAQVYKWVDENGKTHFSDQPPTKRSIPQAKLPAINEMKKLDYEPTAPAKPVVMYSTDWCGYCTKARQYFKRNNIPFREKDIEKSAQAKQEYSRLNGSGVPLILVGKQKIQGFDMARFEALYQ